METINKNCTYQKFNLDLNTENSITLIPDEFFKSNSNLNCQEFDDAKFEKILKFINTHKKGILFGIITAVGIFILFKNRRRMRKFIKRFAKFFKKPIRIVKFVIGKPIKIFKKIKNNRWINNGLTRRIWTFVQCL